MNIFNRITSIHIEPTSECNSRCPQCVRTFGASLLAHPKLNITEISPEQIYKAMSDPMLSEVNNVLLNGNFGDIVMHTKPKEFIEAIMLFDLHTIKINTTGSALSTSFWSWLGTNSNVKVEFGIDGLEDTHHLYRRNTRFDTIMKNAKAYIAAGGHATWSMVVFKHNEHQIDKCEKLANEMGFVVFKSAPSTRWPKKNTKCVDKDFKVKYVIEPSTNIAHEFKLMPDDPRDADSYKSYDGGIAAPIPIITEKKTISCRAKKHDQIFISADFKLWPCCWLAIYHTRHEWNDVVSDLHIMLHDELGLPSNFNSLDDFKIEQIFDTHAFTAIENSWTSSNPMVECHKTCGQNNMIDLRVTQTKEIKT
jgi:hypothetical protein